METEAKTKRFEEITSVTRGVLCLARRRGTQPPYLITVQVLPQGVALARPWPGRVPEVAYALVEAEASPSTMRVWVFPDEQGADLLMGDSPWYGYQWRWNAQDESVTEPTLTPELRYPGSLPQFLPNREFLLA